MTTLDAQDLVPEAYPTVAAALWQPERRLMLAVLEDAIDAYLANAGAPRGIRLARFNEASSWIRSEDTEWPFSFVNICEACGLDAKGIRRMLARNVRIRAVGMGRGADGLDGRSGVVVPANGAGPWPSGSTWSWRSWVPSFDPSGASPVGELRA